MRDKIYMSGVYKQALKDAFNSVFPFEDEVENIQVFDFIRNDDSYVVEVIDIRTNIITSFIIFKDTCDVTYIDEYCNEKIMYWQG